MAIEGIELNAGSGGATIAVDTIDSKEFPLSKIVIGADGTNDGMVSSANPLPITAAAMPLPSGAASAANQVTVIGHLDGLEGLLTTIDADTGALVTSAASIDTKTPALGQALAAASVPVVLTAAQITTLTPPAAITGFATEAKQDSIIGHVDGIEGLLTTIAAGQLPDSHNVTIDNASIAVTGTFWQAIQPVSLASVPSHAVTNGGTFVVQENGGALTALQLIDDAVYTDGSGTPSKGIAVMGTDGTNPQIVSTNASGHVNIADGGNTITVDGTITANAGTNLNTSALALESGGNLAAAATSLATLDNIVAGNEAQCDIVGSLPAGDNNIGNVDLASSIPAGTNNIGDVDVLTLPSPISGPGNPTIDSYNTLAVSAAANTANQSLVSAPGASKQIWIYGVVLTADTGDGSISLQDEDDTAVSGVMEVSRRGGFVINPSGNFAMPWKKVATNKALEIDTVTCGAKGILAYAVVSV